MTSSHSREMHAANTANRSKTLTTLEDDDIGEITTVRMLYEVIKEKLES